MITQDNLNVLFMALPVVASAVLLAFLHIRKSDIANGGWRKQFIRGAAGFIVLAFLSPSFCSHKCSNWQPGNQLLAGLISALSVLLFVRRGCPTHPIGSNHNRFGILSDQPLQPTGAW